MNTKRRLFVFLIAFLSGQHLLAQISTNNNRLPVRVESQKDLAQLGQLEKASQILGRNIKVSQDENLGKIKDLAIDLRNGRIVEVIVGVGSVMGMSEQFIAVPPEEFICDATARIIELKVDKVKLTGAPSFDLANWEANALQTNVAGVYQYFGVEPYYGDGDRAARRNRFGELQRASQIIGFAVHNYQNEKLGKVEDLMVNLSAGRVAEVIVASGGFLGMGDELSPIPPQSFRAGTENNTIELDITKEALANAPHFNPSRWSEANHPENVGTVYQTYRVNLYFNTNAVDNAAQNTRDRAADALTPLSQGNSPADIETTRQIRQEIMAATGLSVDARNVKVITLNGQTTLRGPVKNEDEKRQIGVLAAKVVFPAHVDNQLQVEDNSTTSLVK